MKTTIPALTKYLSKIPPREHFSAETERQLIDAYNAGDEAAGHRLVREHLHLAVHVARKYARWGRELDDLIQQANLGLLLAVKAFNPDRARLCTFAHLYMRAEITRYIANNKNGFRLHTTDLAVLRKLERGEAKNATELAELSGLPADKCTDLASVARRVQSLDAPRDTQEGEGSSLLDSMASDSAGPEDLCLAKEKAETDASTVDSMLRSLSPRARTILAAQYLKDEPMSGVALAEQLGVTKQAVQQLRDRAIIALRKRKAA